VYLGSGNGDGGYLARKGTSPKGYGGSGGGGASAASGPGKPLAKANGIGRELC